MLDTTLNRINDTVLYERLIVIREVPLKLRQTGYNFDMEYRIYVRIHTGIGLIALSIIVAIFYARCEDRNCLK